MCFFQWITSFCVYLLLQGNLFFLSFFFLKLIFWLYCCIFAKILFYILAKIINSLWACLLCFLCPRLERPKWKNLVIFSETFTLYAFSRPLFFMDCSLIPQILLINSGVLVTVILIVICVYFHQYCASGD